MKLFLAPLQSMTTACYRNAFARIFGGIDEYYAPFIATAVHEKVPHSLLKDLLPERNDTGLKVIPQLLGNNGADFRTFASAIAALGYKEINWNIGCPFPMVTNKKKGAGILPYPEMIKEFLDTVCSHNTYTLTVKMRLGLNHPEEGLPVMEVLNQYPLGGVILHARTGIQMYTGKVDQGSFEAMASACKHQITYNGDIVTCSDFLQVSRRFPAVNNFMLGRGALRDPFLPAAIKGKIIPAQNKMDRIRALHAEIFDYYKSILSGDRHVCDKMKEFWSYLSVHTDKDGRFMKKLKKCHNLAAYLAAVEPVLNSPNGWC